MRQCTWTDAQLIEAVKLSKSTRAVIIMLGLIPAGGNYVQIEARMRELKLDSAHHIGKGWNKGGVGMNTSRVPLANLLVLDSQLQSFVLKKRLFKAGIKKPACELSGWAEMSLDGRIPVELDHINGNHYDNQIENLRILCPNCHSLQTTHRGRNKKITRKHI